MKKHKSGFVLQIESGKVNWTAHGNDIVTLINKQIEFDEALNPVIEFAEKDKEKLVIITAYHKMQILE